MDDDKRRELEDLKKKINPEVLARVAKAMGHDTGDAPGSAAPAPAPSTPPPSKRPGGARLSSLKARINRSVAEPPSRSEQDPGVTITRGVSFVIYDPSHFRAKQLGAFIQRTGFPDVSICSDPQTFMRSLVTSLNEPSNVRTATAIYEEMYEGMKGLMESEAIQRVREALPKLADMPLFVMTEPEKSAEAIEGMDPRYLLSTRLSPDFIGKRIRRLLELPD